MPISNSYQAYNTDGTTDPAARSPTGPTRSSTRPSTPNAGPRHQPVMVYSPVPPATAAHPAAAGHRSPRRPGCRSPGPAATSATWPRRTRSWRTPRWTSPRCSAPIAEAQQLAADTDSFKDAETADYVGVAVHCAQGSAFCADAKGVKFGQTDAVADRGRRPAAGRAGRLQRLPGPVRPPVRRPAARRGHAEPDPPRRPGHQRRREPGRRERQPDQRRVPHQPARASPGSARSTRRRRWPTWPTCWSRASRS